MLALHPASHNCPTDSKLCVVISGTICDRVASGGSSGILRCPECVDVMVLPSGILIFNGVSDLVILMRSFVGVDKCVVHPESMMVGMLLCKGGPKICVVFNAVVIFVTSLFILGSPRPQLFAVWVTFLFLPTFIAQHPSIMSNHVASFWCPSFGFLQSALVCFGLVLPPCDQQ